MFSPLAFTLGFALLGALFYTLTLVPVLCSFLLNKNVREKSNPIVNFFDKIVMGGFNWCFGHKKISFIFATVFLSVSLFSSTWLGTEFLPQLNEGALWVTAELPMSMSLPETVKMATDIRKDLATFTEVKRVLSQVGRSNDGTDPNGFYFCQFQVDLVPKNEWKRKITNEQLTDEMNKLLKRLSWRFIQLLTADC